MKIVRRVLRILFVLFILLNISAAFHAYKFTHFYENKDKELKKPEAMGIWDKTKAILFGIDYPKSRNTIQPDSTFNTITLFTEDSLKIEGWHMKINNSKGTVILFHGHGASKSKLLNEAVFMMESGFNVLLIDFRAHGGSDGNTCTIGYRETEEVKLAYDYVRKGGERNITLWGISMGAASISRAIIVHDLRPEKVIMEMCFASLKEAVKARVRIMGLPEQPVTSLLTFWGGTERGFWAFNHNPCEYVKKIHCPTLVQWGALDPRVTREETMSIFQNLSSINKKLVVYENAGHESLLNKEPEKWKKEIGGFLN